MATEAVTFALGGAVDLADLASAVDGLDKLPRALATEAGGGERIVEVTGLVSRDPRTDVPRSVREVTEVRAVEVEHVLGTFLEAEGAVRPVPGAPPSEVIIRNLRDAG